MWEDTRATMIDWIWKGATIESEPIVKFLDYMKGLSADRRLFEGARHDMHPLITKHNHPESFQSIDMTIIDNSYSKCRWVEPLRVKHLFEIEIKTPIYVLTGFESLIRETNLGKEVVETGITELATRTGTDIAALKGEGDIPELKSRSFTERTTIAKGVGYGMAAAMVGMSVMETIELANTVSNLRKDVTMIALNDAAIAGDVLETVQAWREM
jgi:hypothetical protein